MTRLEQLLRELSLVHRTLMPAEVAQIYRVSGKTIERWCGSQEISHIRVGHVIRFEPEDILAFRNQNRVLARSFDLAPAPVASAWSEEFWQRVERLIVLQAAKAREQEAA